MIKIGIIGGSGVDAPGIFEMAEKVKIDTPYGATSTALNVGKINGIEIAVLARHGNSHSITPTKVPFQANIWALKEIGCTHIIATTACGSLQEKIKPSDLIILDQFIDFTKHRNLTFYSNFEDKVIHIPMSDPFCPELRNILIEAAKDLNIAYHETGTVITIEGPRFSTRAESRLFKSWGADVINMSTVPEVILARELGICYAQVAMACDYDSWREKEETVTWEIITKIMNNYADQIKQILLYSIPQVKFENCTHCGEKNK